MAMEDIYMTIKELGKYLKVKQSTIYNWVNNDRIPVSKVVGQWRFRRNEIDEWIKNSDRKKVKQIDGQKDEISGHFSFQDNLAIAEAQKTYTEKRQYSRLTKSMPVKLYAEQPETNTFSFYEVMCKNISEGGALIEGIKDKIPFLFSRGKKTYALTMRLDLPGRVGLGKIQSKIVWTKEETPLGDKIKIGLEFSGAGPEIKFAISSYIVEQNRLRAEALPVRLESSIIVERRKEEVFGLLKNLDQFPRFMKNVNYLSIRSGRGDRVISEWRITVEGTTFTWKEENLFDDKNMLMKFRITEGDFSIYEGQWFILDASVGTEVRLSAVVDWEIPELEEQPKSILGNKIRIHHKKMLEAIKDKMMIKTTGERLQQGRKFLAILKGTEKQEREEGQLKATGERMRLLARQLLKAYKSDTIVAWRSFLVPTEVLYATEVLPFTPEIIGAAIAPNQQMVRRIFQKAEANQYEPKLCSFMKTMIGGIYEGIMPNPDFVVTSSSFCNEVCSLLRNVSRHYNSDFFYLNLPLEYSPEAVEYVASQLRNLTTLLCGKTGLDVKEVEKERLPKAIEFSNQAARYWRQIELLRQTIPSPMSGREALDYATVLAQSWGSPEIVEVYRLLYAELKERVENKIAAVPNEALRLLWLHFRPYYSDKIFDILEEQGAVIAFEEANYPSRYEMDPSHPYQSLAKEVLSNIGQYRKSANRGNDLLYLTEKFKIDGVINFSHDNCNWNKATFPAVFDILQKERGVPILSLSGDCLVKSHDELMRTRLQAFVESLKAKKGIQFNGRDKYIRPRKNKEYFVGIDAGSATTKALILDGEEKLIAWKVSATSPDIKNSVESTLKEALRRAAGLRLEECKKIVSTGIGRSNVPFAHEEITEITCHTEGAKYFFPEVKTIIDIGGQDSKVISVEGSKFRMNDACAAGTGKFLEAMADSLGISLEEMVKLDAEAKKALPVNRMCTVFAQSEVVNLVAKGSPIEEIIRGIHEMVADRTVTSLQQLSTKVVLPLVLSGGVGYNKGVVRAIERAIGQEILVPVNPQIIGALGAAIVAVRTSSVASPIKS